MIFRPVKVDERGLLVSVGVLLYFFALIIVNQFGGSIVSLIWMISLGFAAAVGFYAMIGKFQMKHVFFCMGMFATGVLNAFIVGGTSLRDQILLVMLFFAGLAMISGYVYSKVYQVAFYANVLVVIFKFLTVGLKGQIYTNSSSNFVSVFLLYPAVMYYVSLEKEGKRIPYAPAVVLWILSLLSQGRGGILSSSILLIGILYYANQKNKYIRRTVFLCIGILIISAIAFCFDAIMGMLKLSVFSERFQQRGMSSSRTIYWKDYIEHAISSPKKIIFGLNTDETLLGIDLGGNTHNSFLSIHKNNGVFMMIIVTVILIKQMWKNFKNRNYIFVVCEFTFVLRACTDAVFWPAYGSAVLFYFMFAPLAKKTNFMPAHSHSADMKKDEVT